MGDFALLWADGSADLSILDDDLESDEGLRTAILLSLFTDRRADDGDQLADGEDPRGWWGDEFLEDPNDRFGSKLWQLDRTKITPDLLPRVVDIDREALAWMVEDRVLESIDPEAELHGEHLYHAITFKRPGQDAVRWLFPHVWDGEAARASTLVLPELEPSMTFAGSIVAAAVLSGAFTQTGFTFGGAIETDVSLTGAFDLDVAEAVLIADFDFSEALASWTPGRTGFSSAFATDEWDFQGAAPYANSVGTETLANTGGLEGQSAPAIHDGTGYGNRVAWEGGPSNKLSASGTVAGNSNNEDICVRLPFSSPLYGGSNEFLVGKSNAGGGNPGWAILTRSSAAGLYVRVKDGTNTSLLNIDGNYWDGAPHYVTFLYIHATKTLYAKTDISSEVSVVTVITGSLSATGGVAINAAYAAATAAGMQQQAHGLSICVGTDAQAMYDEPFWQHAGDPSGLLDPADRASALSALIADGSVGRFAADTLPISYDAAFASGLGLLCNNAHTNLVPYSSLSTGAANTNITATDNVADAPDGFRSATTLLATAANGNQAKTCTTVAETTYTGTAFIEEVTAGVPGRVIMYDESNAAELGATAFVGTGTPQVIQVIATTDVGGISTSMRVEVDNNTETAIAWGWQLEEGTGSVAHIPTNGAAASLVQSDYRAVGNHVLESEGELEARFVLKKMPPTGETHYVFDTLAAADRRALYIVLAGGVFYQARFLVNDSSGVLVADILLGAVSADTEYTARCQWDEAAGLGGASVRGKLNAAAAVTGGSAFTSGGGYTAEICIGASDTTADTALDGLIQHIKSYDAAEAIS